MKYIIPDSTLFLDIGGVMLSNVWRHKSRQLADEPFNLNSDEMEDRHPVKKKTQIKGKLVLSDYLNRVVFFKKRSLNSDQFREYMVTQTTPNVDMVKFIQQLNAQHTLKIAVFDNEGRVINEYRIKKFQLTQFVDFFISSCFVHYRKPNTDIFCLALDLELVPAEQAVYIDDLKMFVDVAKSLGIRSIQHKNHLSAPEVLATLGLN
ncbi:MAG: HAD hydrolase-like protein [Bacteroidota bacterium]|nr:HAD hydrolase-like protein [Bacteroidota bacterium]